MSKTNKEMSNLFFSAKLNRYFIVGGVSCYKCKRSIESVCLVYRFNDVNGKLSTNFYCNGCFKLTIKYGVMQNLFFASVLNNPSDLPKDVILVVSRPIETINGFLASLTTSRCKVIDRTIHAGREVVDPNFLEYSQNLMLEADSHLNKKIENVEQLEVLFSEITNAQPIIEYKKTQLLK